MIPILPFGAGGDYAIARSLRIRGSANAGLYRAVATTTNRRKFTLSRWFKLGALDQGFMLWQGYTSASNWTSFNVHASSRAFSFAQADGGVGNWTVISTAVFCDPSAWYHLVTQIDTTDATAANRVRAWVNGIAVALSPSGAGYPALNKDTHINVAATQQGFGYEATNYLQSTDGLHAELHFVDGQLIAPGAFGRVHPATGAWVPIRYEGGYGGANGAFHDFRDATSAAALGLDYSGNGNHLTQAGISVSAGGNCDALRDTPTNNFATLNPLDKDRAHGAVSNANLTVTAESYVDNYAPIRATIAVDSGKWYFEATADKASTHGNALTVGWGDVKSDLTGTGAPSPANYANWNKSDVAATFSVGAYSATANYGDVVMIAIDFDAGKFWAGLNGVWLNAGNPAVGTGPVNTFTAHSLFAPFVSPSKGSAPSYSGYQSKVDVNFGQRDFVHPPPAGFAALSTRNLPPPIKREVDGMRVLLDSGANIKAACEAVYSGADFLALIKDRANTNNWQAIDNVRGTSAVLQPNATAAETTYGAPSGTGVGYVWRRGAAYGFDIVTYTGTGVARTVAHALGAVPHFIIVKPRGGTIANGWRVYHRALSSAANYLQLNTTAAQVTYSDWNSTAPTASVFSVDGTPAQTTNENGTNYVAYLWTEIPGFSRIGAYVGTGTTDGTFVWCGFRPRFVMIKRIDGTGAWHIRDTMREPFNTSSLDLLINTNAAETASNYQDHLANGFKLRNLGADWNASGGTYAFVAFAETPFKFANAR